MKLVGWGTGIGMLLAAAVTFPLARFLYGIGTTDVVTFVAIPLMLAAVALVACYLPARRASRCSPMEALGVE